MNGTMDAPVQEILPHVRHLKVEPLHVLVGVEVGSQVELVVVGGDADGFGEVAGFETRFEAEGVFFW